MRLRDNNRAKTRLYSIVAGRVSIPHVKLVCFALGDCASVFVFTFQLSKVYPVCYRWRLGVALMNVKR